MGLILFSILSLTFFRLFTDRNIGFILAVEISFFQFKKMLVVIFNLTKQNQFVDSLG